MKTFITWMIVKILLDTVLIAAKNGIHGTEQIITMVLNIMMAVWGASLLVEDEQRPIYIIQQNGSSEEKKEETKG